MTHLSIGRWHRRRTLVLLGLLLFSSLSVFQLLASDRLFANAPTSSPGFVFTASGDLGITSYSDASYRAIPGTGAAFHLALGDLAYNGTGTESAFCDYVKARVGSSFPFELVSGNHEAGTATAPGPDGYIGNFASCLPDRIRGLSYSSGYAKEYYFDYPATAPLARIIMISNQLNIDGTSYSYENGTAHQAWLSNTIDAARAAGIPWVIVGMHHQCITIGNKLCYGPGLMKLLINKRVDLVFQGHDHDYQRSKQLVCMDSPLQGGEATYVPSCVVDDGSDNQYTKGAGTVFIINGEFGGGAFTPLNCADAESQYFAKAMGGSGQIWNGNTCVSSGVGRGLMKYTVTADSIDAHLVVTTQTVLGTLFSDDFSITKTSSGTVNPPVVLSGQYWGTFYYPWYGNSPWRHWNDMGHNPPTTWASMYMPDDGSGLYNPSSELYGSKSTTTINRHLRWMDDARLDFALVSWWGQNSYEDQALATMLSQASTNSSLAVRLAIYYEQEGGSDPSVAQIVSDLTYVYNTHISSNAYFKVTDSTRSYPVVFVYSGPTDTVDYVNRWSQARDQMYAAGKPMYIVLKVFSGYGSYVNMVDNWHQYGPSTRYELQSGHSAFASPGYWEYPELAVARGHSTSPLLSRDASAFSTAVSTMAGLTLSQAQFLLIETFNEFHEGSQVEPAFPINHVETGFTQAGPTYGTVFLDIIRNRGGGNVKPTLTVPGPQTVNEGLPLTFTVSASDIDAGQAVTLSASGLSTGATFPTVTGNPVTGTFNWTPAENQCPSNYTITFTANDGTGGITSNTVTVHCNEVNVAPLLTVPSAQTGNEVNLITFTVSCTDTDVPLNSLTVTATGLPAGASLSGATGPSPLTATFSWTPTETQGPGDFTVNFSCSDSTASDGPKSVAVHVNEVNIAPSLSVPGAQNGNELTLITFSVSCTDSDVPVNTLTISATGVPSGATFTSSPSTTPASATFSWTPTEAQSPGDYSVNFTCTDNGSPVLSDGPKSVAVHVNEANSAPSETVPGPQSVSVGNTLTFNVQCTDTDTGTNGLPLNTLTITAANLPTGATFTSTPGTSPRTGTFSFTPTASQNGQTFTPSFTCTDNGAPVLSDGPKTTQVTVLANTPPAETVPGAQTGNELSLITFTVGCIDPDTPAQTLTITATGMPSGATLLPTSGNSPLNAVFNWTPSEAQGPNDNTVNFTCSDGIGSDGPKSVAVHVNEVNGAPLLTVPGSQSGNELTLITFTVSCTDSDVPMNKLTVSSTGLPTGASLSGATGTSPLTTTFNWTPTEAQGPSSLTVDFTCTDNGSPVMSNGPKSVAITVKEVNVAPSLNVPGAQSVAVGNALTFTVTCNDADIPANSLTLSATGLPSGATFPTVTGTSPLSGTFTFTPTAAQNGQSFPITFNCNDGIALAVIATVVVSVQANTNPALAVPGAQTVNELSLLTFSVNCTDPDTPAQTLTITATGVPSGATFTSTPGPTPVSGTFSWTPSDAQGPGSYTVNFSCIDGIATVGPSSVVITVNDVNVAPSLTVPGAQTVDEGVLLTFRVTATDPDPGETIALSASGLPAGSTFKANTGTFSWTPSEAQGPGDFTVSFTATDDGSPPLSDTTTVVIHVNEVNLSPSLAPIGDKNVNEETNLSFTVTATDADIPSNTLRFSLAPGAPEGSSIGGITGVFTWTPTEAQGPGAYQITVIVTDNGSPALSDFETLSITVLEVNVSPVLNVPGPQSIMVNSTLTFTVTATDSDIPSNQLTLSGSGLVSGMIFDLATGAFSFTPDSSQAGTTFTIIFKVVDNGLPVLADIKTVDITVSAKPSVTLSLPGAQVTDENTTSAFSVSAAGDSTKIITLSCSNCATLGVVFVTTDSLGSATGTATWTPTEIQGPGSYQLLITASDGSTIASGTVAISVNEVNEPPVLGVPDTLIVRDGQVLQFRVNVTDSDLPANNITLSAAGLPEGSSFDAATGVFYWNVDAVQPGVYTVTFQASDDSVPSLSDVASVTIHVNQGQGRCFICEVLPFLQTEVTTNGWLLAFGGTLGFLISVATFHHKTKVRLARARRDADQLPR